MDQNEKDNVINMGSMQPRREPSTEPLKLSQTPGSPNMSPVAQARVENGSLNYNAREFDPGNDESKKYQPAQFYGGHYSDMANTAMQNVHIRNLAKQNMEQNRIVADLAKTKQEIDARERMNNNDLLSRTGISFANDQLSRDKMAQDAKFHSDTMNQRDRELQIREKAIEMQNGNNSVYDEMIKRKKLYPDAESFKGALGSNVADSASSEDITAAYNHFLQTGNQPQFTQKGNWYGGTDYVLQQNQAGDQNKSTDDNKTKVNLDINQSNELMHDVAKNYGVSLSDVKRDSNGDIVLPDGKTISTQQAWDYYTNSRGK